MVKFRSQAVALVKVSIIFVLKFQHGAGNQQHERHDALLALSPAAIGGLLSDVGRFVDDVNGQIRRNRHSRIQRVSAAG